MISYIRYDTITMAQRPSASSSEPYSTLHPQPHRGKLYLPTQPPQNFSVKGNTYHTRESPTFKLSSPYLTPKPFPSLPGHPSDRPWLQRQRRRQPPRTL